MARVGFVFPGQGAQHIGMGKKIAETCPAAAELYGRANEILGYDLRRLCFEGPASELDSTVVSQPAIFVTSLACLEKLKMEQPDLPGRCEMTSGLSLGEYTALVAAGVIALGDGVRLVAERGRLMQEAVPAGEGAMAAILGLDDDVVRQCCAEASAAGVVAAVNFNAPGQVVIAGSTAAVNAAIEKLKAAGAKRALPLPVSVPSHCELMRPAAEKLRASLESVAFNAAVIPVVQNVAARIEPDAAAMRDALIRQLYSPVLWVQSVEALAGLGVGRALECGPGKVLCGLNKRIVKELDCASLENAESFRAALAV